MKKIFRSVAALAVVLFVGCTQDLNNEVATPVVGGQTTVTVGIADTKTCLGELVDGARRVYWEADDQIAINGAVSTQTTLNEEKTVAEFLFPVALQTPYSALYPAKAYVDAQTINLPAHQGRGLENVDNNALPMAGYAAEDGAVTLHHLAGAVKYQISCGDKTTDMHSIRRLEVWGNNNEQMAGDFVIDYQSATLTAAGTNAESKVVVEIDKDQNESGIVTVYAVLPAIEYTKGITVRLIDKAGHYMDLASKAMTIEKGEIKAMPAVEFVPTGTIIDAEISIASAAEWNAFVKEYNADKYEGVVVSVKFTQDIVFDDATNAEFQTIESSNGYFMGVLDGQNYSIKGLKTNKPIFNSISGSVLKNIVIDASCEWNYSDISLDANTWFGTLAVDIFSTTAENITMKANTTFNNITSEGNGLTVYTGNIFGRTNAHCVVKNCVNDGAVETLNTCNFGLTSANGIPSATVYTGGIVGYSRCLMENCTNNGAITSDWNAKTKAVAGIAGRATGDSKLVNCGNTGTITDNSRRKPAAPININDYNRTVYIAGVVGYPACDVLNCENSGNVICNTNVKSAYAGGVIAYGVSETATLSNLTNTGTISSTEQARYPYIGGIIGQNRTPNISNLNNEGAVTVSKNENNATVTVAVGGVIGLTDTSIVGNNTITNSGAVTYSDASAARAYAAIGGIVGATYDKAETGTITISGVSNSGAVKNASAVAQKNAFAGGIIGMIQNNAIVENVSNSGAITFTDKQAIVHINVALGGIVGCVGGYNVDTETLVTATISNATNTGMVARSSMAKKNGSMFIAGGIVGILKGAGSSVSNSNNNAQVSVAGNNNSYFDANFSNTGVASGSFVCGGIVGYACGTADSQVTISGCTNHANDTYSYGARGYVGGIVGYAWNTAVSSCNNGQMMVGANTSVRVGGIAGHLNASTVTGCSIEATIDGQSNGRIGGIAGSIGATSSIASSTFSGKVYLSTYNAEAAATNPNCIGAIAGYAESGATINTCGAKGEIGETSIAAITLDNFVGSGAANITGSYLLE